jgi:hypothetical protein
MAVSDQRVRLDDKPSPVRGPERERLAEAITKHIAERDRLQRLSDAYSKAQDDCRVALDAIDAAEALLAEAREDQPRNYVQRLLDDTADGGADLVAAAQSRLSEAHQKHKVAGDGIDLLAAEIKSSEARVRWAKEDVGAAIGEYLRGAPEIERLIAKYDAARSMTATLAVVLGEIERTHHGLPPSARSLDAINRSAPIDDALVASWRLAVKALEGDPDATLPQLPATDTTKTITRVERVIVDPRDARDSTAPH